MAEQSVQLHKEYDDSRNGSFESLCNVEVFVMSIRQILSVFVCASFVGLVCNPLLARQQIPQALEGGRISADRIIENPDSTVTFIHPWISGENDFSKQLEILGGVPGACRLFGLDDYLRGHVIWSKELRSGAKVGEDGAIGNAASGHYIESMTCLRGSDYIPSITVEEFTENPDGSITVTMPVIHTGNERHPIVSGFSTGACRLLGYNTVIQYSQVWSEEQVRGVSLGYDGQIYEKSSGTYLIGFRCKNRPQARYSSNGRRIFEEHLAREQEQY